MKKVVAPGEKQFTASVVLVTKTLPQRVLLVNHKKLGVWLQPGGHIEPHENPIQAAVRECREETGLDISDLLVPGEKVDEYAFNVPVPNYIMEQKIPPHGEQPEHFHIDCMFVVHVDHADVRHQEDEADGIGWFTLEEVLALTTFDNTRWLLKQVLS